MNKASLIKRSVLPLCGLLAISPLSMASSSDTGTLTIGQTSSQCSPLHFTFLDGFLSGSFGSYSPTGLSGGDSVLALYDQRNGGCAPKYASTLGISGLSSNPGSGWLISITCNGVENTGEILRTGCGSTRISAKSFKFVAHGGAWGARKMPHLSRKWAVREM